MERLLLSAAIADRKAYEEMEQHNVIQDFSEQGKKVYEEARKYYHADNEARSISTEILLSRLFSAYPLQKHKDLFSTIVENLDEAPSIPNILTEISNLRKDTIKEELRAALEGGKNEKITELLEEWNECQSLEETIHEKPNVVQNKAVTSILDKASSAAAIRLSPDILNATLDGGLLRGHHLLFFARPDCGKTTFAIEQISGFLKQGLKVLYIGNEDPMDDVLLRILTRLTHLTKEKIEARPDVAQLRADKKNYENLVAAEMYPGTIPEIEEIVDDVRPDVLVIDQVRNLKTKTKGRVEELENVCRAVRNLGKKYDMVTISLTQAGDSAQNKRVLDMGDVDWSNTGMQATADVMIGMGINNELEVSGRRILSFPKNKRGPNKDPIQVQFDGKYNRIH
mgnify:CR=1 FL=1